MDTPVFWLPIILIGLAPVLGFGLLCLLLGIRIGVWLAGKDIPAEPEPVEEQEEDKQPQWERDFDRIMEAAWKKKGW